MVITVWLFGFVYEAVTGNLDQLAGPDYFNQFINSNAVFVYFAIVAAVVNIILVGGVKEGIERAAKIMMPLLFVMLIGLVIFVLTLDNAFAGVRYYLVPDFSKINASVINGALSQAFFSLSLGMGIMITYGSYMRRGDSISNSAKFVAMTDTAVAFSAGLMILPAIFAFNPLTNTADLSDSSIGLIFTFLPKIFLALQATIGYFGASAVASTVFLIGVICRDHLSGFYHRSACRKPGYGQRLFAAQSAIAAFPVDGRHFDCLYFVLWAGRFFNGICQLCRPI